MFTRTLRMGQSGADVKTLQTWLSDVNYKVPATGYFGAMTKSAVRRFQLAHRLYPPSGSVGNRTASTLQAAVRKVEPGGSRSDDLSARWRPGSEGAHQSRRNRDGPSKRAARRQGSNRRGQQDHRQAIHLRWWAQQLERPGYDCSGAVSYALHGGGLLSVPLAVEFEGYGSPGPGTWISVYADSSHVFAAIAGLAFDTANYGGPNIPAGSGPRWRYNPTGNLADGGRYVVRHPAGL